VRKTYQLPGSTGKPRSVRTHWPLKVDKSGRLGFHLVEAMLVCRVGISTAVQSLTSFPHSIKHYPTEPVLVVGSITPDWYTIRKAVHSLPFDFHHVVP
jgi:hypothetical protein